MNPIQRNLEQIWEQLRLQKRSRSDHLEEVHIKGLRGITDLRVSLPYPVTVFAGANGSGKSTALFALACAYKVPGAKLRDYVPSTMFPGFHPVEKGNELEDKRGESQMVFAYVAAGDRISMRWSRGKGGKWSRSFLGQKGAVPPERILYLRTLANLANPSEVRSILQMAHQLYESRQVDAASINFAERILGYRYASLSMISHGLKDLLFARRENRQNGESVCYSEFHMSAGERALIRLSLELSSLNNAIVLIDEVETGLHPYVQQMLLLELQRLALRNQLQIVVTTHSPVVLDSVPPEGRVFLERDEDNVIQREPYRDIIQKSLYGQAQNKLSFLCEDEIAEALLRGTLEAIGEEVDLIQADIEIGKDTGKDQYVSHLETLAKFRRLHDVVFVLDGDGRDVAPKLETRAEKYGQIAHILFLPGTVAPEEWCWDVLSRQAEHYGMQLGLPAAGLVAKLSEINNLYAGALDKPVNILKAKFQSLAGHLAREATDLARLIGREETRTRQGEIQELVSGLKDTINSWRARGR